MSPGDNTSRVRPDAPARPVKAPAANRPTDDGFVLEDYIYYNINHASNQYGHRMEEALARLDIDQTSWRVLSLLHRDEDSRLSEIARRGMMKVSTLSRRIDRMVEDGLVLREVGTDDRRTVRVSLTELGRQELERARSASAAIFDEATAGIAPKELATAVGVLRRMRANLESGDKNR
ncbi:MAG: MarR family transcriptional regulator [Novosphingobium sp.]